MKIFMEIRRYLMEYDADAVVQHFEDSDAFDKFYFSSLVRKKEANVQGEEKPKEEDKTKIPLVLDLVIFDYDSIKDRKVLDWTTKAAVLLKRAELWPQEKRPKFIALAYEESDFSKGDFAHPFIDDLITLPLDRLIFLQKVEIIIKLPDAATPSFLFVQETEDPIEVARKVKLVKLSDLTATTESKHPMKIGSLSHIRFRMAGEDEFTSFYGRVIKSEEQQAEERVYHITYAMSLAEKSVLKKFRNFVTQDVTYKLVIDNDEKNFEFNPDNIFLSDEEKEEKTVVIIDPDENFIRHQEETFAKELGNIRLITDTSWARFYQTYLMDADEPTPCSETDLPYQAIEFVVTKEDLQLIDVKTSFESEDQEMLGWKVTDLFGEPEAWKKLFDNEAGEASVTDMHRTLPVRKKNLQNVTFMTSNKELRTVGLQMEANQIEKNINITITLPDTSEAARKAVPLQSFDALFIHQTSIYVDPYIFVDTLNKAIEKKSLKTPEHGLSYFLLADKDEYQAQAKLIQAGYTAVLTKPMDTRQAMHWASSVLKTPFCLYNNDNIGQREVRLEAMVSVAAMMRTMSEFGSHISMKAKLKLGSMVYLFGSIFDNAPHGNISCRVYATKEDETEKGHFISQTLYFGINEKFLKLTRNYIREKYADDKSKGGGE